MVDCTFKGGVMCTLQEITPDSVQYIGSLKIRSNIVYQGQPIKIVSQDPSEAPTHCEQCGAMMLDHPIGEDNNSRYFVRSCPFHPYEGWNTSRLKNAED